MKCPHCLVSFHEAWTVHGIGHEPATTRQLAVEWLICPSCRRTVVGFRVSGPNGVVESRQVIVPKSTSRPVGKEVEEPFAADFKEASLVLADSPKASAAISRRCLQLLLREKAKVKPNDLSKEIDEVLTSRALPSYLANAIDAIRHVGNFAAHPMKSTNTGEVVDVEPGEAEWLLDTLEGLFDFYFVQPSILKSKSEALNKKLGELGKPPMKTS